MSERGGGGDASDATTDGPSRERDDRTLAPEALAARYDGVDRRSNRIELPAEQFDGLVADEGRWGVGALVTHEGRALLVREGSKASDWVLPGGKLEVGETHAEGATREVYEETGVEVVVEDLLAVSEQTFVDAEDGRSFEYYFATFGARPVGDPAVTASDPGLDDEDIVAVEWHATAPDDALDRDLLVDLMGW